MYRTFVLYIHICAAEHPCALTILRDFLVRVQKGLQGDTRLRIPSPPHQLWITERFLGLCWNFLLRSLPPDFLWLFLGSCCSLYTTRAFLSFQGELPLPSPAPCLPKSKQKKLWAQHSMGHPGPSSWHWCHCDIAEGGRAEPGTDCQRSLTCEVFSMERLFLRHL